MNQHLQKTIDKARAELEELGVDTHDVTDHALLEAFEKLAEGIGYVGVSMASAVRGMVTELRPALEVYAAVLRWNGELRFGTEADAKIAAMYVIKMGVKTDDIDLLRGLRHCEFYTANRAKRRNGECVGDGHYECVDCVESGGVPYETRSREEAGE